MSIRDCPTNLQEAQAKATLIFGDDGVAMIGKLYEVGRWTSDRGCGGDFLCLGRGESWEEAFKAIGVMEPITNP